MSTTYRMEINRSRVQMTVIDFDRAEYKRVYQPTEATIDRFTAIAAHSSENPGGEIVFEFNYIADGDGFGWRLTRYDHRNCSACGKPIYEFQSAYKSKSECFDCRIKSYVSIGADRITAPIQDRFSAIIEPDGDVVFAQV